MPGDLIFPRNWQDMGEYLGSAQTRPRRKAGKDALHLFPKRG